MADGQRTLTANFTANSSGFAKGTTEAIQRLRELNTELAQVKQSVKTTNAEIRGYEKQLEALKKATNNGEDATEEQRKEMQKLEDAIAKCTVELGSYQTEQQRLQSSIRAANKQIDDQGQAVDKTADKFKKFGAAIAGAGTAVAAGITFAVTKASEMQTAVNDLTIATGASADEAARYKQTIEAVYGDGLGDDLKDVSDSVAQIKRNLKDLNNTELTDVTESALALRGAFGYDVSESSRAARALQQNFNISAKDAYNYIYSGAQSGLDYAGDFLDSISEYSVQFAKMGLSADEMFAIFSEGAENGAWNIDKVGDAVKEMAIRVIDGSKSTQEGFALINMSADEMAQKFAQGGETARQAFDDTLEAIKSLEDPVKQDAAGVALLGTMWEDLSKDVVFSFTSIEESSFKASDALESVLNSKDNNTERQAASLRREIELVIINLGNELLPIANEIIDDIKGELPSINSEIKSTATVIGSVIGILWEARDAVGAVASGFIAYKAAMAIGSIGTEAIKIITGITTALKGQAAAQLASNSAVAANPFGILALGIGAAVTAINAYNNSIDDCFERMQDMNSEAKIQIELAEEYAEKADGLDDIVNKYDDITQSSESAYEQEQLLQQLQQDLIDQYGEQALGIDLVTLSYDNLRQGIIKLRDEYSGLSKEAAQEALDSLNEAEKQGVSINFGSLVGGTSHLSTWAQQNLSTVNAGETIGSAALGGLASGIIPGGSLFNEHAVYLDGTYEEMAADLEKLYNQLVVYEGLSPNSELVASVKAQWDYMVSAAEQQTAYEQRLADLNKVGKANTTNGLNYLGSSTSKPYNPTDHYMQKGLEEEARKAAISKSFAEQRAALSASHTKDYNTEKQLADDMYGVGEISAREYYDKLTSLRDHYLEAQSHEWYVATKEIKSVYAQLMKDMGDATDDSADRITNALGEVKTAYQDTLEAIDRELERRNREKQDEELNRHINAVTARLAYEQIDEYSRIALEKQLEELQEKREDIDFERNINDSKAQLEAAYNATQGLIGTVPKYDPEEWAAVLGSAFDQITEGYLPKASAKDQAEASRVYNVVINAENKTTSQIVAEVKRAISSGSI